ncbi:MAG: ASKHA domain-containing protein [Clostridiales bacterium]|nr:ASKHA domain-containing protein [Clostridiales bacterium]
MKICLEDLKIETDGRETILDLARRCGTAIPADCSGNGLCGKCKIQVTDGQLTPLTDTERKLLSAEELEEGYRLACCVRALSDASIRVPGKQEKEDRKGRLMQPQKNVKELQVSVKKYPVMLEAVSLIHQKPDRQRLTDALYTQYHCEAVLKRVEPIRSLAMLAGNGETLVTAVVKDGEILAVEDGDTSMQCYGIAVDIGTTSVVVMLWDLNEGRMLQAKAMLNPQSTYGADVISRIHFCGESEGNLQKMQSLIVGGINELTRDMASEQRVDPERIYLCAIDGNTTMSHLFLGVNPKRIARAPFIPAFQKENHIFAADAGICMCRTGEVFVLPNLAGHVGSDITAGILAVGLDQMDGICVMIDVGTNGEIVLAQGGVLYVCSTAAGPAFEGAAILHGMRAASGAIEGVMITDTDVKLEVIGGTEAVGICGSGLIDAVSELLSAGIVDWKGKLLTADKAREKGIADTLCRRLRRGEKGNEFVLFYGEKDITLTQKDIREVQMAKAAIHAGLETMLLEAGCSVADIDGFYVAGAFGSYIKKESALTIGLFPEMDPEKITFVGNAAGDGVSLALLTENSRERMNEFAGRVRHVELSVDKNFQDLYLRAMNFGKNRRR